MLFFLALEDLLTRSIKITILVKKRCEHFEQWAVKQGEKKNVLEIRIIKYIICQQMVWRREPKLGWGRASDGKDIITSVLSLVKVSFIQIVSSTILTVDTFGEFQ